MPRFSIIALPLFVAAVVWARPAASLADASAPDAAVDGDDAGPTGAPDDAGAPPSLAAEPPPKVRGEVSACSIGAGGASPADAAVLALTLAGLLRRRRASDC
jgi:hypothetical protein